MWSSFSYDVKFDLVMIAIWLTVFVVIGSFMVRGWIRDIKRNCREIKVLQNPGEYTIETDSEGKASFVIIADGHAKKITLKRGE